MGKKGASFIIYKYKFPMMNANTIYLKCINSKFLKILKCRNYNKLIL